MDEREAIAHLRERLAQGVQAVGLVLLGLPLAGQHRVGPGREPQAAGPRGCEQGAGVRLLEEHVEVHAFGRIHFQLGLEQLRLSGHHQPLAQHHAVHELHRQPGDAVDVAGVHHAHDVGVVQVPQRFELAPESPRSRRVRPGRKHLQGDRDPAAAIDRAIDGAEAAAADLPLDAKWAEPAGHEGNLTRTTRRAAFLLWCPRPHASYRTGHRPAQGGGRAAPAPAPCGHHHGRKWPLGGAAGAAPAGRSSPRKRFRGGGDARRAPPRPERAHPVRVLFPELGASARGSRGPDGPAARLPASRAAGDHGERHPAPRHRRARSATPARARSAGGPPPRQRDAHGHDADARAQLRRPRGDHRHGGANCRRPHRPDFDRRQGDERPPLDRGAAAARARRAHQRGVPCLELPPLAAGVCGDPFHRDALARFRRARSAARHRGFPEARTALREDERADPHRMSEKNRNLVIRVTTAVVLLPGVLWLIWRGGFPLALLIGAAAAACAFELNQLPRTELSGATIVSTAAAFLIPLLQEASPGWVTTDLVLSAVVILAFADTLLFEPHIPSAPRRVGLAVLGAAYPGLLLAALLPLRGMPRGEWWILLTLTVTWLNDSFAYFAGRAFGRRKLYERISPSKTWEGALGGAAGSIAGALVVRQIWLPELPAWGAALIGAGAAVLGPLGDLSESMLKRAFGAKDSGRLLPGHGGLLDRIDALLFNAPFVLFCARLLT